MRDQPEETQLQSSAMHIYTPVQLQRPKKSIPAGSDGGWGGPAVLQGPALSREGVKLGVFFHFDGSFLSFALDYADRRFRFVSRLHQSNGETDADLETLTRFSIAAI